MTTTNAALTKLTVNLVPKAAAALAAAADQNGDTRTDTVNRALQVYALVTNWQLDGLELQLVERRAGFWARLGRRHIYTVRFGHYDD